jgi:hypothetical protein
MVLTNIIPILTKSPKTVMEIMIHPIDHFDIELSTKSVNIKSEYELMRMVNSLNASSLLILFTMIGASPS